jgi:hypothetical protein
VPRFLGFEVRLIPGHVGGLGFGLGCGDGGGLGFGVYVSASREIWVASKLSLERKLCTHG